MIRSFALGTIVSLLAPPSATGQHEESYGFRRFDRDIIQRGVQAIPVCNGLFASHRTLEQVIEPDLVYLVQPVRGREYCIDEERQTVGTTESGTGP